MSRGRRQIGIDDASAWIFNRMAEVYDSRPAYPKALVDALVELATAIGSRVLDIGAGTGHLALPMAQRGLDVVAVEPASAMLERLRLSATNAGTTLCAVHAAAEALPFQGPSFDVALVADALHFIDAELAAAQLRRVLVPRGILAVVTCEYTETPFMRDLRKLVAHSADRRPRDVSQAIRHLASLAGVKLYSKQIFQDETPVDTATLERILQSVSFIGPAMNPVRFATLSRGLRALPHPPIWARTFTLHAGRRRRG
jgi:ubiquinone/menaquinone biosynthesis C-methylase UbiE